MLLVEDTQAVSEPSAFRDPAASFEDSYQDMIFYPMREAGPASPAARAPSDFMRHISAQLVEIARSTPDKPIELTLNPEELGRLRMTFQTEAASLNVILQVDRPETLELMRRHIDLLAQDMREIGYDDVTFTFQQQDRTPDEQRDRRARRKQIDDATPERPSTPRHILQIHAGRMAGVDIRI